MDRRGCGVGEACTYLVPAGVLAHVCHCAVFVPWTSKDSEAGVLVGHPPPCACRAKLCVLVTLRDCACLLLFLSLNLSVWGKSWAQGGSCSCVWVPGMRGPPLVC